MTFEIRTTTYLKDNETGYYKVLSSKAVNVSKELFLILDKELKEEPRE